MIIKEYTIRFILSPYLIAHLQSADNKNDNSILSTAYFYRLYNSDI